MDYQRADTAWMANSKFGISIHWTSLSMPSRGERRPYREAVENFNVEKLTQQFLETGADYLVFTPVHCEHYFPGPVKAIEDLAPGRTLERDLVGEIATAVKKAGKKFILYYTLKSDRDWTAALDYFNPDSFDPYINNLCHVVRGIAKHYQGLLDGWWFDCGYYVDTTGPENRVEAPSIMGKNYRFPWETLTEAVKTVDDQVLLSYSCGANQDSFVYTDHQDFWHGERGYFQGNERNVMVPINNICLPPPGRYHSSGLQWQQWTCLDNREWVHLKPDTPAADILYTPEEVYRFLQLCNERKAAMTFNVEIFQEGIISDKAIRFLNPISCKL